MIASDGNHLNGRRIRMRALEGFHEGHSRQEGAALSTDGEFKSRSSPRTAQTSLSRLLRARRAL